MKYGFNKYIAFCTNIASQEALKRLGFKDKNKILYNDYKL